MLVYGIAGVGVAICCVAVRLNGWLADCSFVMVVWGCGVVCGACVCFVGLRLRCAVVLLCNAVALLFCWIGVASFWRCVVLLYWCTVVLLLFCVVCLFAYMTAFVSECVCFCGCLYVCLLGCLFVLVLSWGCGAVCGAGVNFVGLRLRCAVVLLCNAVAWLFCWIVVLVAVCCLVAGIWYCWCRRGNLLCCGAVEWLVG